MEAIPLSEISAVACACALVFSWITHFGVPETITSDHGPQFTSNFWSQLCKLLQITYCQTTAYHPVKRCSRKTSPSPQGCATILLHTANWAEEIPWVILCLHAQPREDSGLSPAEAVFGAPIVLPSEFLQGDEISKKKIFACSYVSFAKAQFESPAAERAPG
jgi:hypothetical protein